MVGLTTERVRNPDMYCCSCSSTCRWLTEKRIVFLFCASVFLSTMPFSYNKDMAYCLWIFDKRHEPNVYVSL